ncbi:protein HMF1 [Colletotrichum liriopes]|uniref:Protein HMF1 n=1 Tax=Colletotrichum liriopes TaxID=708192 RepID=A0AA37GNG1_9PEZI|nr:protein HMF1 [Colletotrichum liriopes]
MSDQSIVFTKNAPARHQDPHRHLLLRPDPPHPEGNLLEGSITDKTKQCIANLKAVLVEAGSSIEKVVKVNIFLADMGSFAEMNGEYEKWFTHKPARSCVAVKTLPKNVDVEIEAIALP